MALKRNIFIASELGRVIQHCWVQWSDTYKEALAVYEILRDSR